MEKNPLSAAEENQQFYLEFLELAVISYLKLSLLTRASLKTELILDNMTCSNKSWY